MNANRQRSLSYHTDRQSVKESRPKIETAPIEEEQLFNRVYFGSKTHLYIGCLRYFKLGGFQGTSIHRISDLAKLLHQIGILVKPQKEGFKPLELSSIITELGKVEALIKKEDTANIDPYGYDVNKNH